MNVFVSYSHKDWPRVAPIANALRASQIDVWLDEWKIVAGDEISTEVESGLKDADYLLLMLSEHSLKSGWVEREWRTKFQTEIKAREVAVICVRLDPCEVPLLLSGKKYLDAYAEPDSAAALVVSSVVRRHQRRLHKNPMLNLTETIERMAEQRFEPTPLTSIRELAAANVNEVPAAQVLGLIKVETQYWLGNLTKSVKDSPDEQFWEGIREKQRKRESGEGDAFDALAEVGLIHHMNKRKAWLESLSEWESRVQFCSSLEEPSEVILKYLLYHLDLMIAEFIAKHQPEHPE